jgi:low temperature requirement protein LtrA
MSAGPENVNQHHREVSPLELFFDLVFVFAVSQLAHHLYEDVSWRGAAETTVLLIAVFGVWTWVSFEATLLDVARAVTQWSVIVVMGLSLFLNAGISHAFDTQPWTFVFPLLIIQIGQLVVPIAAARHRELRRHYARALVWTCVSAPLWVVGACVEPHVRLAWWAAAAAVELSGTWAAHPLPGKTLRSDRLAFDADHMRERLRLFLIIALGETVLTIGRAVAEHPSSAAAFAAGILVFVALVCLWASYFAGAESLFSEDVSATTDPITVIRLGMNVTYIVFAGLVALAVGSELAIAHPEGHGSPELALLLLGGPALYLAGAAGYFWAARRANCAERVVACLALGAAGIGAVWLPVLVSLAILAAILLVLVAVLILKSQRAQGKSPPSSEPPILAMASHADRLSVSQRSVAARLPSSFSRSKLGEFGSAVMTYSVSAGSAAISIASNVRSN